MGVPIADGGEGTIEAVRATAGGECRRGRVKGTLCGGKVLDGIGRCAAQYGIPVVALAGGMGPGAQDIYRSGIDSIMVTENSPMTLTDALSDARALTADAAERMFRLLEIGGRLGC